MTKAGKVRRKSSGRVESFRLAPGRVISGKYEVVARLGAGWEAEVYQLREKYTGIECAGKFFFPQRNQRDKTLRAYARKLHKLRNCPILIQYHTSDFFHFEGQKVTFLVSELVEGEVLSKFLARQPGKKIPVFQALHLLHALAKGLESIHHAREYHGDLHGDNIIVRRRGISFDLKVLDLYDYGRAQAVDIHDDVCDLVRIFYDAIGGKKHYHRQPPEVKAICRGLKRSLILQQFRTAGQLRHYLETMDWS
jgi:serine/threonine protein kinase